MKIGIFGGTFDPPHLAHQMLAEYAVRGLRLDRLLWVLTLNPPHKEGEPITKLKHRMDMVTEIISDEPRFELSPVDIDRPPPHYAVDTILLLRKQFSADELIYLMGGDSLRDLPGWHMPTEFVMTCDGIAVFRRPEVKFDLGTLERKIPGLSAKVQFVDAIQSEISASNIRQRVRNEKPFRDYVHPAVYQIIEQRGLYKE